MRFDCNVIFGYWRFSDSDYSLERVTGLLESHGIDRALLLSSKGIFYDDFTGNDETFLACSGSDRFLPVGTLNLSRFIDPEQEVAKRKEQGFKAFRLFIEHQGIDPDGLVFKRTVRILEKNKMPLIIRGTDFMLRSFVDRIARAVKDADIPVIILDVSGYSLAGMIEAAKFAENLYFSTRLFTIPQAVEMFCEEAGPDRLLLGTGIPFYYGNQSILRIETSDISEQYKQMIFSENLINILGGAL